MQITEETLTTEQKILQAARKLFIQKGLTGTRMDDIAKEAGINKALLHYYFRSKEKLFELVFEEESKHFLGKILDAIESDKSLFEKIAQLVEIDTEHYLHNSCGASVPMFVFYEMARDPELAARQMRFKTGLTRRIMDVFGQQIKIEIEKGTIRPIDPSDLFINIMGLVLMPFMAKPMLQIMHDWDEEAFRQIAEKRKKEITEFIINAIKV
ncbi:TetR/AcrR family transcriptional regulator [Xanthocytophaga agilis]|uniref:TetR/AcrR family transcriptional regulator n=1 Tax=Xanthocytophaga agilis TaxID=3048010 RepID=A0AAE3R3R5_9BACT|nr:TetR/AcrR family transcriptional regulator [Xanthocytophaga agilis]MDJ1503076.1 TetR/AcrR family transcriptional regulator [Xanthocytophaga agilis]